MTQHRRAGQRAMSTQLVPMPALFLVLVAALALAACGGSTPAPTSGVASAPAAPASVAAALPAEVTIEEALALRDAGAFVLDVREPDEWAAGHAEGATLIPLGELAGRVGELPREADIVVVCRSGNRSAQGRDILLAAGFPRVTSLAGGMNEWMAAGVPIVTGP